MTEYAHTRIPYQGYYLVDAHRRHDSGRRSFRPPGPRREGYFFPLDLDVIFSFALGLRAYCNGEERLADAENSFTMDSSKGRKRILGRIALFLQGGSRPFRPFCFCAGQYKRE